MKKTRKLTLTEYRRAYEDFYLPGALMTPYEAEMVKERYEWYSKDFNWDNNNSFFIQEFLK